MGNLSGTFHGRKRQRSMDAAGRLLRAGGRLVPGGDEETLGNSGG